jgi:hypothetical protein
MKLFDLPLDALVVRFYLMMVLVIVAGFTDLWLLGLLALPIFFSALMGIKIQKYHGFKKVPANQSFERTSKQHHTA